MADSLFSYLKVKKAVKDIPRLRPLPSEFTVQRADVDVNIRTSNLPIMIATHGVLWSNGGQKKDYVPARMGVPRELVQKGHAPLDYLALRTAELLKPCRYQEEINEHLSEMCRGLAISGSKDVLVQRLTEYDERREGARPRPTSTDMQIYIQLRSAALMKHSQKILFKLCTDEITTAPSGSIKVGTAKRTLVLKYLAFVTKRNTIQPPDWQTVLAKHTQALAAGGEGE